MSALDDGVVPGGYVRDIVERVTPSILFGRSAGLTRVDEFEARHVTETVTQLRVRSATIAQRIASGDPGDRRRDLPPGRWPGGVAGSSGRHRRRLTRDTPSHLGRLCVTWPYREVVLDLEPHGPLPTQIYWRRRALAIGIAVLVIGVIAAVVVMVVMNSTGTETKNAAKPDPTPAAPPTPLPGENPEVKTPVVPPAASAPAPTPTPTAAVTPPPVLQEGDDCPDSTLAVKGITSQPQLRRRRPAEVHHGRHEHRPGGLQA